jgi:putative ABC transport system permease protein
MSDDLRGLARVIVRLLPARIAERCFLPTYFDLLTDHLTGSGSPRRLTAATRSAAFHARVVGAGLECALRALNEAGQRSGATRARPGFRKGIDQMLTQDLRFALRMLWKNPGFTSVATIALALGIGANTAIFSIVHAVLLRPLPFHEPERILELTETARGGPITIAPPNLLDWKARNTSFSAIAAYDDAVATLTGAGEPEQIDVGLGDAELFPILGIHPLAGRTFVADDMHTGAPPVVVLGYGTWQRRFGGDRTIVGRTLTFDGRQFEVIGIMPRGFSFPAGVDVWFPLKLTADEMAPNQRGAHYLNAVGRLKEGVTAEQAIADLARIEAEIAARYASVQGYGVWAMPLLDSMVGSVRRPLLMLLGAVGFVLLIACANVSSLLLARASARRTEIAVRCALGAGRWRIVRQLLAESVVLACAGGVCGVLLAAWGIRALDGLLPQDFPRADAVGVNLSVLSFSLLVSISTALAFGIAPSLYASRPDVAAFLKDARREGSAGLRHGSRRALIALEVALALVLLAGAGLALRSFARLTAVDPGFNPEGVLALELSVPDARYSDPADVARFYQQYVEALAAQPGVVAAGGVMRPPLTPRGFGGTFSIIGSEDNDKFTIQVRPATAGYFEALGIPLRRGRLFTPADRRGTSPVVLVSEEAARRFWPGKDPVGQALRLHVAISGEEPVREVAGVVGDVKLRGLESRPSPVAYVPHGQYASSAMTVFIRTHGDPSGFALVAKTQLALLDREVAPTRIRPAAAMIGSAVAQPRFRLVLLGLFATIALTLAAVGLYGMMAFSVSQRQGEIGIRMALGADRTQVMRLVLRQGLMPVAIGMAAGLLGAAALTQLLAGLLFEISPLDPATYLAVASVLGAVAAIACYIPARRATRVDPLVALRTE